MNCQNHTDAPATAYCRSCGKPVCDQCRRDAYGTVFCAEHAPVPAAGPPAGYIFADASPGLALILGLLIPGVGAIYNGQYAKGLVHAVIFGVFCTILRSGANGLEPVFGILLAAWIFYMGFEAYHTARKRRMGEPVDEYSSLINLRAGGQVPVAGVVLILLGAALLLHTLDLLDLRYVARFWPVLLIAGGAYMLYVRFSSQDNAPKEAPHERR
ncbi:MAG: B-box zinc finger protein [Bryobacteraceae bacterium]|jgi:TM2 domain-containing membrane protein YozV